MKNLICSLFAISLSTSLLFNNLCADEAVSFKQLEQRLCKLEKKGRHAIRYNPGAAKAYGPIIGADALYWQARENGIPYAIAMNDPLQQFLPPDFLLKSHIKEFDFDWDFGVRVHGGWQFHRDNWRILGTWTHFDTKAQDHGFTVSDTLYRPIWSDPRFLNSLGFAIKVKAKWKLFLNQADLMLSRAFYVGKYFVMEPAIGASGVWIDQRLHSHSTRAILPGFDNVKLENDFKGVGIRGGLSTRFYIRRGFNVFNTTHLGLYYGKFELERKEKFVPIPPVIGPLQSSIRNDFWQTSSLVAMQMGVGWDHQLANNRYSIAVKLAYEYQVFFAQNQFLHLITLAPFPNPQIPLAEVVENQGDLSLTGGTFSILFSF